MLDSERQQLMKKECNHSPSDLLTDLNESQRKRIKTEQIKKPNSNHIAHDISNDDLNAAFHEDDIILPTQIPPTNLSVHKSKKMSPPNRDNYSKEQNKENDVAIVNRKQPSPIPVEQSPTVLNKHSSKLDVSYKQFSSQFHFNIEKCLFLNSLKVHQLQMSQRVGIRRDQLKIPHHDVFSIIGQRQRMHYQRNSRKSTQTHERNSHCH